MSEHAWVLENIETYNAGGLEPDERERLQQHVAECSSCAAALDKASTVDQAMEKLFADARPALALEDRMIRRLRARPERNRLPWLVTASAAAIILFGIVGAGAGHLISNEGLPFPGNWRADSLGSRNHLSQLVIITSDTTSSMSEPSKTSQNHLSQLGMSTQTERGEPNGGMGSTSTTFSSEGLSDGKIRDPEAHLKDANELAAESRNKAVVRLDSITDGVSNTISIEEKAIPPDQLNALGYYPPSRGLVVKGSSRIHTNVGGGMMGETAPERGGMATGGGEARSGKTAETIRIPDAKLSLGDKGKPMDSPPANNSGWDRAWFTDQPSHLTKERTHGGIDGEKQLYSYRNDAPKPSQVLAISPDGKPAAREMPAAEKDSKANKLTDDLHFRPPDSAVKAGDVAQKEEDKDRAGTPGQQGQGRGDSKGETGGKGKDKANGEVVADFDTGFVQPTQPVPAQRKIIRSGDIEFEIESFDSAVATVTKLINAIKGGFIATVNSDRLPNGKVRGSVVVRVPPEALDSFVLDLRKELGKGGELKSLKIGSQDITKQYTDLEGKLKAARTMEERLLRIIKEGKGEIKDLLNAEKELGVWRTKIEEFEGEIRYYANQVALSTLTITLYEKEIRAPYAIVETERISMGVEVEDVEKAQQQLLAAVIEAKGRITKSELKQQSAGQYQATIHFEVAPEGTGPLRDRLRQLGTVARLDIGRVQQSEGGSGDPRTAKSKRQDTQFFVDLYNVATIAPHETVQIHLACVDTEAVFRAILSRVRGASGRVVTSNLNRQKDQQTTAAINCEVKTTDADALLDELKKSGDMLHFQITENPDMQHATRSRRGFIIQLYAFGTVQPRETQMLQVASRDVPAGYRALLDAVNKAKGRVLNAQLNEQDKQNIFAQLDFDIRRADATAVEEVLAKLGDVYSRTATRAEDSENVLDTKLQMKVTIKNVTSIPARRTVNLALEVGNVEETVASMTARVTDAQGRTVGSNISHERSGRIIARLIFDVPLARAEGVLASFRGAGIVRVEEASINQQVPDSSLAIARLDVTLSNSGLIIPSDEGLWARVRAGLSNSLLAIFWSLSWVIFGVLVLLPWALVIYAVYRIVLRFRSRPSSSTPAA